MKILTALDNQLIQDNLKNGYSDIVPLLEDINYQEGVIDALKSLEPDALIMSCDIQGDLNRYEIIEAVRNINDTVKIVLVIKNDDKEYRNWLASKGVFDVLIDGKCTFNDLVEALQREQRVIIKTNVVKEYIATEKVVIKKHKEYIPVSAEKHIFTVWGNTEFGCEFAYITAKLSGKEVIVVDLDFESPIANYCLHTDPGIYIGDRQFGHWESGVVNLLNKYTDTNPIIKSDISASCVKRNDAKNLYVLTADRKTYEDLDAIFSNRLVHMKIIIETLYRNFDYVVLLCNQFIDKYTLLALEISHNVLVPVIHDIIDLNIISGRIRRIAEIYKNVNPDKFRYIGYMVRPFQLDKDFIKKVYGFGKHYIGCIHYSDKQARMRSSRCIYAQLMLRSRKKTESVVKKDYLEIMMYFNIIPKLSILEKFIRLITIGNRIRESLDEYREKSDTLQQKVDKINEASLTDPLTSAYNRRKFDEDCAEISKNSSNGPISYIMLDIDYFKRINDNYGHTAGDYVLKEFVYILKQSLRKGDRLYRYGGEEFCIILSCGFDIAMQAAERLRRTLLEHPFTFDGLDIKVTASFGVSEHVSGGDFNMTVKNADSALYDAKNAGRNCVRFFVQHEVKEALI